MSKALGLWALLSLAACDLIPQTATSPVPQARPEVAPPPPPPVVASNAQRSDASRALSVHYQRVQNDLVARGLLRTDGGGPDTAFTDTVLGRNFVRIALFDEFVATPTGLEARPTISRLRRWEQPIRFTIEHGATVPDDQRTRDANSITSYVNRLERVTGHPMSVGAANPNFHVLVLNEDDRLDYGPRLRALVPGIDETSLRAFLDVPRDTLCLVLAFSVDGSPNYSQAVALIRGEHPDLMRLACVHEELAQGLGLANDSPRARPSIFNDDEEFALLTTHDELLLQMLYDRRLQTGMTAAEAAPIARTIATELMNTGPS
ncbi:DUF2927 domain-containing protein [Pseudooctadecabacter jejudonensis]|uniref:DUF2927 domain-containing protein n=1 Tax=Pseudooctadecabacter jejudonensis TaxID=1391910 RepID=A0A1Y5RUJ0_9RHOB|nr:DUF2927 domain-containing protein [Pseudooctadecabacter jejudonensis]SLN23026.1 hypothetical protein PSJ8397_00961 [Pseudooctadecabacter jejudonensis]